MNSRDRSMKIYKPFLMLTLLIWSSFASSAFDYNCIDKDKPIPPEPRTYTDDKGTSHDTDAFKAWKDKYGAHKANWKCCDKLILNASTKVCEDQSMADSALKECTGHGECSDGKGCFERSEDDMFNPDTSPGNEEAVAEKEKKFEEQQNSLGDKGERGPGEGCYRNMECESYSCKNFKCEAPPSVCRLAGDGETAPSGVKCEEGLEKDSTSKCTAGVDVYTGDLGKLTVGQNSSNISGATSAGLRCEYKLFSDAKDSTGKPLSSNHIRGAINLSIRTLRSMEWLYSTVSNPNHKDCLFQRFYMKEKMQKLINERKLILKAYNEDMQFIESSFDFVKAAELNNQTKQVTTLCADAGGGYEVTTQHDVASRKASGLDFLCYMKERNLLYQEYELKMLAWAAELQTYTKSYRDTVFNIGEKDKHWTTGDKSYSYKDRGCRDWTDWHKKVKRRWSERYKVKGSHNVNANAVNVPGVSQYLSFLSDSNAPKSFNKGTYYLLDPLMPGGYQKGVGFENFGASRNLNGKFDRTLGVGLGGTFGSLAAGFIGAAVLGPVGFGIGIGMAGGNGEGLVDIYDKFDARLLEYVKSLRVDLEADKFIYEPEIAGSYEMRGCAEGYMREGKLEDEGPNKVKCKKFVAYMSDLKNYAFAQFLAHSRHYKKKYKQYFKSEGIWRRKLFARYDVDLVNIQKYYVALSGDEGLRTKQNICLDALIKGINKDFGTTEGVGVSTGESNYYNQTSSNYMGNDGRGKNYNKPKIKGIHKSPGSFKLSALNFSFNGNNGKKDGATGNNGAGSGSISAASIGSDALAARSKEMEMANAKAAARGVDLNARALELEKNMAQGHLTTDGSGSMASPGGTASGSASGSGSSHKATIGDGEEVADDKNNSGKGIASGVAGGAAPGVAGGANAGALAGIAAGSGPGMGTD